MQQLVQQALKALKIDTPVFRAEVKGDKVTLWLCNHYEPVTWSKPKPKPAQKTPATKTTKAKS